MSESEERYRYAWDWFEYHAKQRLTTFNFFLIVLGAIGYVYIFGNQCIIKDLVVWLALLGAILSFLFLLLEVRNTILVDDGRHALEELEEISPLNKSSIRYDDQERFCIIEGEKNPKLLFWKRAGHVLCSHTLCLRLIFSASIWGCLNVAFTSKGWLGEWFWQGFLWIIPILIFFFSTWGRIWVVIFWPKIIKKRAIN